MAAMWAVSAAAFPSASPRMVSDTKGAAAFLAAAPPLRRSFLDVLSGEEVALAGAVLVQARVEWSDPAVDRANGRILNVLLDGAGGRLRPDSPFVFYNVAGYALENASAPVLSLYLSTKSNTYATLISTAVGYANGDTLVYRRRTGAVESYDLRRGDNLFGCIQQARVRPDECRLRRLSRYGVRSAAQQRAFRKIEDSDAWLAALWMLVRKREPNAVFPTRECKGVETTDCVSWAAFKKRSRTTIPTD
jgi:hypothetical protein